MTKILGMSLISFVIVMGQNIAAAEPTLEHFVGDWVGQGKVRSNGFGEPEKLRCKVQGERDFVRQISFAGKCVTASGSGMFRVTIAEDEIGSRYGAKIRFAGAAEALDMSGSRAGNRIVLATEVPIERNGRQVSVELSFEIGRDSVIVMRDVLTDINNNEVATALFITFKKSN